jgi:hypothetical protein
MGTLTNHRTALIFLAVLGALSRLPFLIDTPINWDAVQFALALDRFDLHDHQPHPPGYILYVLLGRAMRLIFIDSALALSLLSVLFSAAAAPLLFGLVLAALDDKSVAWCAAILYLASPLALYYGAVGLTYLPEMTASVTIAWLAWRCRATPGLRIALALGLTLGLAVGLRQTALIVFLPLCMWAIWGASRRVWLAFSAALIGTCLTWLVPLLVMSGGVEVYLRESALLAESASGQTSLVSAGLEGLLYNLAFIALSLGLGVGFALVPLGLWAARVVRFSLTPILRTFLLVWTLPTIIFYALTHVGQYGYLLAILPPLLILASLAARVWGERVGIPSGARTFRKHSGAAIGIAICLIAALSSTAYFLLARGPITANSIWGHEIHWRTLRSELGRLDPGSTVLVMQVDWESPFRLAGYLLPQYHSYTIGSARPGDEEGPVGWLYSAFERRSSYRLPHPQPERVLILPPNTHRIIALDEETAAMLSRTHLLSPSLKGTLVSLDDGTTLYMLDSPATAIGTLTIAEKELVINER